MVVTMTADELLLNYAKWAYARGQALHTVTFAEYVVLEVLPKYDPDSEPWRCGGCSMTLPYRYHNPYCYGCEEKRRKGIPVD